MVSWCVVTFTYLYTCIIYRNCVSAAVDSSRLISSTSVSDISNKMKEFRSNANLDERSSLMLDALRGKNINDDDKQGLGINMKLVEVQ